MHKTPSNNKFQAVITIILPADWMRQQLKMVPSTCINLTEEQVNNKLNIVERAMLQQLQRKGNLQ